MNPERGSLLIVDDDPAARVLLRHYLTPHGFDVTDAADGAAALALLERQRFDLVLLDVEMPPGPGGLEVLRNLRTLYSAADLPVMMATVRDGPSDIVEALNAGANDYVTKPFNLPVVLARLRTQHSLRQAVDRAQRLAQSLTHQNTALEQANEGLATVNRRMRHELAAAALVQEALLPAELPDLAGARFAWHYQPCAELAGDLLGLVGLDDRRACLYVLDVVDHGVKAALLAVMINRVLSRLLPASKGALSPIEVAAQLNQEFPWDMRTQQFFTLMLGVLDRQTGEFRFVSAGQPGPIHLPHGGEPKLFRLPGVPIGLGDGDYEEHRLSLGKGDRLYLYTDGLPEAMSPEGRAFTEERCGAVLAEARGLPLEEGLRKLVRTVEEWCAPRQPHDDLSLVAVELV
jgi:sigma-B regulation protein RsbU (phosphoserine phosphatase)